jgi:hypothetical protein
MALSMNFVRTVTATKCSVPAREEIKMRIILFIFAAGIFFLFSFPAASTDQEESEHSEFVLLDYEGNEVLPESTVPYSPRNTCGECHDYDAITLAYHFQQGRTDSRGNLLVNDDKDPKRPWLISHGMYGKW